MVELVGAVLALIGVVGLFYGFRSLCGAIALPYEDENGNDSTLDILGMGIFSTSMCVTCCGMSLMVDAYALALRLFLVAIVFSGIGIASMYLEKRLWWESSGSENDNRNIGKVSDSDTVCQEPLFLTEEKHILSELNDIIQNRQISEALQKITDVIDRLQTYAEENPDDISRLEDYYLPTVEKLARIYADLEKMVDSEEVDGKTRCLIEDAMPEFASVINSLNEQLMDDRAEDTYQDVDTEISVFHRISAMDGLTSGLAKDKDKSPVKSCESQESGEIHSHEGDK